MAILRIKWVGEPPILLADGFTVGNWKHENTRTVAVPGTTWRKINHKNFPKLSRSYVWGLDTNGLLDKSGKTLIQPVEERDWALIHEAYPYEFKDVTNHPDPESVSNDPLLIAKDPISGQWYKSR
jgi:hypothetical protein